MSQILFEENLRFEFPGNAKIDEIAIAVKPVPNPATAFRRLISYCLFMVMKCFLNKQITSIQVFMFAVFS